MAEPPRFVGGSAVRENDIMSTPNFRNMSPEQFKAFQPSSEDEARAHEEESKFRDWCDEHEEDPESEDARDNCNEATGKTFWDDLDENDRAGWEDDMTKD